MMHTAATGTDGKCLPWQAGKMENGKWQMVNGKDHDCFCV
jgi:hypothetical protein